jgi:HEAT repeat protein
MEELTVQKLVELLKSPDPFARRDAWLAAGPLGAAALRPLADLASEGELEISRAANRGMWQIVRYVGAPGREELRRPVVETLGEMLGDTRLPLQLRRDIVWMLSEIIKDEEIDQASALPLLLDADLGEDVRMALQRVAGPNAIGVLKAGFIQAQGEHKTAIACSLRKCGVAIDEPPCPKLVPRKTTTVKPVGRNA